MNDTRIATLLPYHLVYPRLVRIGVGRFCSEHRIEHLRHYSLKAKGLRTVEELAAAGQLDGLIVFAASSRKINWLAGLKLPSVNVSARIRTPQLPQVVPDNHRMGVLGAQHLLEQGHRRLAFVSIENRFFARERQRGFVETCISHGVEPQIFKLEELLEALPELLRAKAPLAVMTAMDRIALDLVNHCLLHRIPVPEKLALASADNSDIDCLGSSVSISSVDIEGEAVGYRACSELLGLIESGKPATPYLQVKTSRVMQRDSSAPILANDDRLQRALQWLRAQALSPTNIKEIASRFKVPRRSFDRAVMRLLGRTSRQEMERLRMERARELLVKTNLPVAEIAEQVGYLRTNRFSARFTAVHGVSPRQYRRQAQGLSIH